MTAHIWCQNILKIYEVPKEKKIVNRLKYVVQFYLEKEKINKKLKKYKLISLGFYA